MNKFLIALFSLATATAVSCSNDDEPQMPANAISLNMMIGDSETTIGGSDVYINSSNNFTSNNCGIADLGRGGGFNRNPDLTQIAWEAAVTPGNYYQLTLNRDIRTVAGARAIPVKANYYNLYVDSWLYDKDNDLIGAKIKYAECTPKVNTGILPEWDTTFPVYLKFPDNVYEESATYTFDKNVKIDSDYLVYDVNGGGYELSNKLKVNIQDNQIVFSNTSYTPEEKAEVIVNIRYESLYSQVRFLVTSSIR